ncbi:MAG: GH3 auxin-responsive promoter family protein, partial [Dehalococcoidales bacterium]
QGRTEEAWQRCCGFIDLSLADFMRIQSRLLEEQLELMKRCELGKFLMNGAAATTVAEFRDRLPLTTYDDYAPYLIEKREDALPMKPALWQYTSGKSGDYPFRWAPITGAQLKEIELMSLAIIFFSACRQRGDIAFDIDDRALYGMAPPPYATGTMVRAFPYEIFRFLPPVEEAEKESFDQRMKRGFDLALSDRLDLLIAMSSVANAIAGRFQRKGNSTRIGPLLRRPKALLRLLRGLIRARIAGRNMLPRDLWNIKGLVTFGIDSSVYRKRNAEMWGREPLEFHGSTETVLIATQTWDHAGMTFFPYLNFFEFIPEEESLKSRDDPSYRPKTLLLDEVTTGKYELVITSLHGGPFLRYRLGHLIEITALRNEQLNIDIPQMVFLSRVDDQLDIAGFTRLSEKTLWQAIVNAGLDCPGWVARKETDDEPVLQLYVEMEGNAAAEEMAAAVHAELCRLDTPYAEMESITGLRPIKVTLVPDGAFADYETMRRAVGSDLTQLKPPHINPSDEVIDFLMGATRRAPRTKVGV